MELQNFMIDADYSYTLLAANPTKNADIAVSFNYKDEKQQLSSDAAYALFLAYPGIHKNFHRLAFKGEASYRVFVDDTLCTSIVIDKTFDEETKLFVRRWYVGFTPIEGGETRYFDFSWGMLPKLMKESIRLINAVQHWQKQINAMHQRSRDECATAYAALKATNTRQYGCNHVLRKRWSRICNCCEVKGAPKFRLPAHIGEKVGEWKGTPYMCDDSEKQMVDTVGLSLGHYGDENYF